MILFVDDEKRYMDTYMLELVICGYDDKVRLETNVDTALQYFERNLDKIELIILDIMMPAGESFKNSNTLLGLRTGVDFYERVRKGTSALPVIIFTNVSDPSLAERFSNEKNCMFMRKTDYLPHEFAEEVQKLVPLPVKK